MRHENVKDARRLDALVRLHSTVLDPDLEIRRWGEGVGQRSSRPLDKGGGGAVHPQTFSAPHMFIQTQGVPDRSRVKKPLAELLEVERALIRFTHADILLIYFSTIQRALSDISFSVPKMYQFFFFTTFLVLFQFQFQITVFHKNVQKKNREKLI